jgi:uncharacterized protein YjiK
MKLMEIVESLLLEQDEDQDTVQFPKQNFYAYFDEKQRKIVLAPIKTDSASTKTRIFVNLIKQNFKVQSVQPKQDGSFEVKLDPFEDFLIVKDYIIQQAESE